MSWGAPPPQQYVRKLTILSFKIVVVSLVQNLQKCYKNFTINVNDQVKSSNIYLESRYMS